MARNPFDVFISYSRMRSSPLAIDLQQGLERYAKPWNKLRAVRVFRDDASMSANAALWSTIVTALGQADWFILIATPESAASKYVNNEVAWWVTNKTAERVLIVHAGGTIEWSRIGTDVGDFSTASDAIPNALRGAYREEPRWIDLTWYDAPGSLGKADPRFLERVVDLAAPVRNKERDEMVGENVRQHRRTQLVTRAAIAMLSTLLVLTLVAGGLAWVQRSEALRERDLAIARQLIVESKNTMPRDPRLARLMAVAAARIAPDVERTRATSALRAAIAAPGLFTFRTDVDDQASSGKTLAMGKPDGSIELRDLTTGALKGTLSAHQGPVRSVAMNSDGSQLASSGDDGTVRIWDLESLRPLHTISAQYGSASEIAINRSGELMLGTTVSQQGDRRMAVWSTDSAAELWHADGAESTCFNSVGTSVAVGYLDGSIQVRDARTGRITDTIPAGAHPAYKTEFALGDTALMSATDWGEVTFHSLRGDRLRPSVSFPVVDSFPIATGKRLPLLLAGGTDDVARIWDITRDGPPIELRGHVGSVDAVALSDDDLVAATGGTDGTVRLWSTSTGLPIGTLGAHQGAVTELGFDTTGRVLISRSEDHTVRTWSVPFFQRHSLDPESAIGNYPPTLSADGKAVATGGTYVKVWSTDGTLLDTLTRSLNSSLWPGAFSADGTKLVVTTAQSATTTDGMARIFETATGTATTTIRGVDGGGPLNSMSLSPDGSMVAGEDNLAVRLWSAASGQLQKSISTDNPKGRAEFSPSGATLAMGRERDVILVDVKTGEVKRTFSGSDQYPTVLGFSPDGKQLAITGLRTVDVVDMATGHTITLTGHTSTVFAAAFDESGSILATAGDDRVIWLWDVATGAPLATLDGAHTKTVDDIAFRSDGALVSVSDDISVALWDTAPLTSEHPIAVACGQAGTNISEDERNTVLSGYGDIPVC